MARSLQTYLAVEEQEYTKIHDELNGFFLGGSLSENHSYQLSSFAVIRTRQDGSRSVVVRMTGTSTATFSGKADVIIRDAAGNVVGDSRAERIRRRQEIAALAAKHRADPVGAPILRSYRAAAEERQVELVRLYEIRDALAEHFGDEDTARKTLGISKNECPSSGSRVDGTDGAQCDDGRLRFSDQAKVSPA